MPDVLSGFWQYRVVDLGALTAEAGGLEAALNKLGDEGWDLVATIEIDGTPHLVFKKPKKKVASSTTQAGWPT